MTGPEGPLPYLAAFFLRLGLAFLTCGAGGVFSILRSTSSGLGVFAFMVVEVRPWIKRNQRIRPCSQASRNAGRKAFLLRWRIFSSRSDGMLFIVISGGNQSLS